MWKNVFKLQNKLHPEIQTTMVSQKVQRGENTVDKS